MSALLEVDDLVVRFPVKRRLFGASEEFAAVDGVTLKVERGQTVGVVGESGSGKSTLARTIVGLTQPSSGEIRYEGEVLGKKRDQRLRRKIQMVFQDPGSSLNPSMTVRKTLSELLKFHDLRSGDEIEARCRELVALVNLPEQALDVYPRRLSGGQKQRVAIARALALEPELIIADEPVAALDVSVQAAVLNVMADLQQELGIGLIFISHDLAVVRHVCRHVAVMYKGKFVEEAPVSEIFNDPQHDYTKALLAAVPSLTGPRRREEVR
ncbi:MAG: peptide/nickel transport system ATP-binding protein [Actinomycetota bacterium]|nr:peptide/nickel transport system ATP-binding protein [Actinomycetota bacterium]